MGDTSPTMAEVKRGHEYKLTIDGHPEKVRVKQLIHPKYAKVETKSKKIITCGVEQLSSC